MSDEDIQLLTLNSKIDLYASTEDLSVFKEKKYVFQSENDNNGVNDDNSGPIVKIWCLEKKPDSDLTLQAVITKVVDNTQSSIYGNIVGVPTTSIVSEDGDIVIDTEVNYSDIKQRPILVGRKYDENKGEVFNAPINDSGDPYIENDGTERINNTAMGEYTASFGHGSRSGIKGYKILNITIRDLFADIKIDGTLSEKW